MPARVATAAPVLPHRRTSTVRAHIPRFRIGVHHPILRSQVSDLSSLWKIASCASLIKGVTTHVRRIKMDLRPDLPLKPFLKGVMQILAEASGNVYRVYEIHFSVKQLNYLVV